MTHKVFNYVTMKLVIRILTLLWILPLTLRGDDRVTCVFSEECVLPCTSDHFDIIHWYKDKLLVHSYYYNADQLDHQTDPYKGRTSLFPSEIQKGNVSLKLKDIRIKDEGKYKCYTADTQTQNSEKYVDVSVEAPVESVDITLKNDKITCNTSRVYPAPIISWSPRPPENQMPNNKNLSTDENLFTAISEIKTSHINNTYMYRCSITDKDKKIRYEASLKQQEVLVEDKFIFPCADTKGSPLTLSLTFDTLILSYDTKTPKPEISERWKHRVSFSPEDGTVKLYNLIRSEHTGTFICESTTAQSRHIIRTIVTLTECNKTYAVVISIGLAFVVILSLVIVCVVRNAKRTATKSTCQEAVSSVPEEHPLSSGSEEPHGEINSTETNGTH